MRIMRVFGVLFLLTLAVVPGGAQPPTTYRILVTNDDGIRAPGILALAQALKALGEVTVVAPVDNQSGKGHSISITDPIFADPIDLGGGLKGTALTATPASCVKVAVAALMRQRPDLVVSGVNRGYNLGYVAYVSGTVGAAREAALEGIPAIATSMDMRGHPNYDAAAQATANIAGLVKARGLPKGVFLNVNVPVGSPKGIRLATQTPDAGHERYVEHTSPRGRRYFWNVFDEPNDQGGGGDVWATSQGFVAVAPLRIGEFDPQTFESWKSVVP